MRNIIISTFIIILSLNPDKIFSQGHSWVTVTPTRGYFTFKMPAQPAKYDTLNTMFYTYSVDSELVMQVYYYKADSAFPVISFDSTNDPLLNFAAHLIYSTSGTLTEIEDINFTGQNLKASLKGKEVGISYFAAGQASQVYLFTRIYYDGQSFLVFNISAPATRINDLLSLKSSFFKGIKIHIKNKSKNEEHEE